MNDLELKNLLDSHYALRNTEFELSLDKPDPLFAVRENLAQKNIDEIAVVCALLAYGNAGQILKTLLKLKSNFALLGNKSAILKADFPLYRFQTSDDIKNLFLALSEIIERGGIKRVFMEVYLEAKDSRKSKSIDSPVICGINAMISALLNALQKNNANLTQGLRFLIGQKATNPRNSSPLKRWNLFLRWMGRKDNIDLGFWAQDSQDSYQDSSVNAQDSRIDSHKISQDSHESSTDSSADSHESSVNSKDFLDKADLILPLDTHTFRLSKKLNLLQGKTYNLHSALEITRNLAKFCPADPVKYDFALYRLGQEKLL